MNLYKLLGCILVVASSTGIGMFFSNEIKNRLEDLKEIKKMILLLKGDIRYANTPLPEAVSNIARRNKCRFGEFLMYIAEKSNEFTGITFSEVWMESVNKNLMNTSLNKKDKEDIIKLGENLGYLDKHMQINTFDFYLEQLENEISDSLDHVKQKTYLFNSLGIMAGLFICIIML